MKISRIWAVKVGIYFGLETESRDIREIFLHANISCYTVVWLPPTCPQKVPFIHLTSQQDFLCDKKATFKIPLAYYRTNCSSKSSLLEPNIAITPYILTRKKDIFISCSWR